MPYARRVVAACSKVEYEAGAAGDERVLRVLRPHLIETTCSSLAPTSDRQ